MRISDRSGVRQADKCSIIEVLMVMTMKESQGNSNLR